MSYSLETPAATTSTTQEVDVYEYTWDLYTTTSVNAENSTVSDTYTTTSYASTSSSSAASSIPITYSSFSLEPTDWTSNNDIVSVSYTGCFVAVEADVFTTYGTSDMVSSISLEQSTSSSSSSSSSYYEAGNTYTAREITTTQQVVVTTASSWNTFSGYDFEGAIILPHEDDYLIYGTSTITLQSSTSEESSTSSSTSESTSWSGVVGFPYVGGYPFVGGAIFEGTTYPSLPIFDDNSSYGAEMFPQYDTSSIHPNVIAPVSYLSFTPVEYWWVNDPYANTSTTFPDGYFSQSDSTVFVLQSSKTTESDGATLTVWETTSSTYTLTYTIENYTSTFNAYFSKTSLGGGQAYSLTFDVGFYAWTINGQTESMTDSCSFSMQASIPTTTTSTTYEVITGGYSRQTYGNSDAGGTQIVYTSTITDATTTWVTNAEQGTNYDTSSSSASWSGLSFPEGITTSSCSSTSGNVAGSFYSNISSAGVSSTEISVPDGSVFVFSALYYYGNSLSDSYYWNAPTVTTL